MNTNSLSSKLITRMNVLQQEFIAFLNSRQFEPYIPQVSPIEEYFSERPFRREVSFRLTNLSPSQARDQKRIIRVFNLWVEDIYDVVEHIGGDSEIYLATCITKLEALFNYPQASGSPRTYQKTISSIQELCLEIENKFIEYSASLNPSEYYVLDTSAILDCPNILQMLSENSTRERWIVIPPTTLKELEELKTGKRDETFRRKLSAATRYLNEIFENGDPHKGKNIGENLFVKFIPLEPVFNSSIQFLDPTINDDRILATTFELQKLYPFSSIILLANDLSMQNKARMQGIKVMKSPDNNLI